MNISKINAVKTKRCGTITYIHLQRAVCTYRSKTEVFVILVVQRKGFNRRRPDKQVGFEGNVHTVK